MCVVFAGEVEHGGGDEVAQPGSERGKSRLDVPSLPEVRDYVSSVDDAKSAIYTPSAISSTYMVGATTSPVAVNLFSPLAHAHPPSTIPTRPSPPPQAQGVVTRESLECLMDCLRACYDDHPYHCWRHAVDVTHSAFTILTLAWGWVEEHLTTLDVLCLMVAALGHDVRHRGVSNQFLTRTGDLLALTYNDQSVQEMMHAASFFQLIRQARGWGMG